MRCYFIRDNKREFVEPLEPASDEDAIRQADEVVRRCNGVIDYDALEIWDDRRLVHRALAT